MLVESRSWGYGVPGRRSRLGWRSRPGREGGHEHFRSRGPVAQRGMGAAGIVMPSPALDHDLGLLQSVEDLAVQEFISQPRVNRLHIPVLPRRAWRNIRRLG